MKVLASAISIAAIISTINTLQLNKILDQHRV